MNLYIIDFSNMSLDAYNRLFTFLYLNKCLSESKDEKDGTVSVSIRTGIEKIEFFNGHVSLISELYDCITFSKDEFYKVSVI